MSQLIRQPSRILIVKPSSMGDVVHALPVLNALKTSYPYVEIDWVIAKGLEGLLLGHRMINDLIVINKDDWKALKNIAFTGKEIARLFERLKGGRYDIAIDLQGLLRSALITVSTGASVRIGFSDAREGSPIFYNHTVKGGSDIHAVDRYMKIAYALGCSKSPINFPFPEFNPGTSARDLVSKMGTFYVLIPGARWQTKKWLPESFAALIDMLDHRSVLIGGVSDKSAGSQIAALSGDKAVDAIGDTSIQDMIYIISNCRAVITNDTGPMHIAAALGKPVVALFGPTNPMRTGPYGTNNIVIKSSLDCAPCYKKSCSKDSCMNNISVQEVYDALERVIS